MLKNKKDLAKYKSNVSEAVIVSIILIGLIISSFFNYLLFHSFAELFSVTIAFAIFLITWHSRNKIDSMFLLVFGISSLFIGFVDLIHTLAYKGMGVFPGYDANLPTQLWIAARYLQAFSIFFASLIKNKKINLKYLILSYIITCAFLIALIFTGNFPDCFIEGSGLTSFKIISEYIIDLIFLVSILLIYKNRKEFDKTIITLIIFSIVCTMISEFSFTFYVSVYGLSNLIGHVFKIIAFYLIYKAVIQFGLKNPINLLFRKLKESEENYREAYNRASFFKDLFTHDISNIFQNIASSLELSKMYQKDGNDQASRKFLPVLEEQIVRGKRLILNVRKLSEISDAEISLKTLSIKREIKRSVEFIKNSFQEREVFIEYNSDLDEIWVNANELISEVFENILINAIKYNNNAVVEICIETSRVENFFKLEFKDNGIGVEDSRKELIFKKGFQESKGGKGMGIGLYFITKILNLYNGKIKIEDRVKGDYSKGSNFVVLLPAVK